MLIGGERGGVVGSIQFLVWISGIFWKFYIFFCLFLFPIYPNFPDWNRIIRHTIPRLSRFLSPANTRNKCDNFQQFFFIWNKNYHQLFFLSFFKANNENRNLTFLKVKQNISMVFFLRKIKKQITVK
jgi:hypothetical protein